MSFTPEALYIIGSCDEQDNKKIFMSSPACADGYDTPAQQREDSTTFMVAKVSSRRLVRYLAAAVTSSEAGSDSDDSDASPAPAATAAAAPAASAPSPRRRSPRIYCYTGDRAQDEAETNRRLRHGLCLKCLPHGAGASRAPFAFGS